jgi:hypothetical protein
MLTASHANRYGEQVITVRLRIHHQHAPSWIALPLACDERGGQLPLAGRASGITLGVESEQDLRRCQAGNELPGDAVEFLDPIPVDERHEPAMLQRGLQRGHRMLIGPRVAEEHVISRESSGHFVQLIRSDAVHHGLDGIDAIDPK